MIQKSKDREKRIAGTNNPTKGKISRRDVEARRYAAAVDLYAAGDKSLSEIAGQCVVRVSGLAEHISRYHKDLVRSHYGNSKVLDELNRIKARQQVGQSRVTHLKYYRAIEACSDITYIEFNVQQLARLFNLSGNALLQQLKTYYPSLLEQRERTRRKLGIAKRGPRKETESVYSEALTMFRDTNLNLAQVAEKCGVSRGGFSRFMRCYHKDLVQARYNPQNEMQK